MITIRDACIEDLHQTFLWANNHLVRRYSFSQDEIKFEDHSNWFSGKIRSDSCYFFIAEMDQKSVGSVRFDIRDGNALISYLLDPGYHGKGLGTILLEKGIEFLISKKDPRIRVISGEVFKNNIPSIKAFEKLGFESRDQGNTVMFEKSTE